MSDQRAEPSPGGPGHDDEQFGSTAGWMLRESAEQLDAATAARLRRARLAALDALGDRRTRPAWLIPGLSAAALGALAVALAVTLRAGREPAPINTEPLAIAVESVADLDLLLAADSLELLEDLEFYVWLDAELRDTPPGAEPGSGG